LRTRLGAEFPAFSENAGRNRGSGSTLIAAERTGRCCRGVELDPLYVDVILSRYQRETGESAILEATGETFDELRENRSRPCGDARGLAGRDPP
jgi:hypothetical protein